jgi:hypothetical protein
VESKLGPLGTSATYWPIVPGPGDCENGEFGGINGRGNRSTQRKPAPTPLCPPQISLDQNRDWTRAAAVGSQRLTASTMARPYLPIRAWHRNLRSARWIQSTSRIQFFKFNYKYIFPSTSKMEYSFQIFRWLVSSISPSLISPFRYCLANSTRYEPLIMQFLHPSVAVFVFCLYICRGRVLNHRYQRIH